jgi:hypothetical protein
MKNIVTNVLRPLLPGIRESRAGELALVGVLVSVLGTASANAQNWLVDPGYEQNPVISHFTVLNNFAAQQGTWGVENSTITGLVGGLSPAGGAKMLSMRTEGLFATQAWQVTDVSANPFITAGNATFTLSALFNAENIPAARANVVMQFYNGAGLGFEIPGSQLSASMIIDNNPVTWQPLPLSGTIPAGTTWMVSQVSFVNSTIGAQPGFVDDVGLQIVPSPGSLALLSIGGLVVRRRR